MNGDELHTIMHELGELKAGMKALDDRMDRTDKSREGHLETIYGQLDKVNRAINIGAGVKSVIGWIGVVVVAVISAIVSGVVSVFTR